MDTSRMSMEELSAVMMSRVIKGQTLSNPRLSTLISMLTHPYRYAEGEWRKGADMSLIESILSEVESGA